MHSLHPLATPMADSITGVVYTVLGCDYSWTSYNDSNVYGGTRYELSNSVEDCQASCTRDANCTGVDYNPLNAEGWRCFLILTAGDTVNVGLTPGVTHYALSRNCSEFVLDMIRIN